MRKYSRKLDIDLRFTLDQCKSKVVVMMAQCTAPPLSMVCLGSRAITHQALQLQVKGQRARGRGHKNTKQEVEESQF